MRNDALQAVKIKLKRAASDIRKVDVAVHNFKFSKPYALDRQVSANGLEETARLRFAAEIPDEIAADATNAIHNLRTSLDILAWAVAIRSALPPNPGRVRFPVLKSKQAFEQPGTQGEIVQWGSDWLDFVSWVKPYPEGNDALCRLHQIDNIDKHRDFVRIGGLSTSGMAIKTIRLGDNVTIRGGVGGPLDDGMELISYPVGNSPDVLISIDVALRNLPGLENQSVVKTLGQFHDCVTRILNAANTRLF